MNCSCQLEVGLSPSDNRHHFVRDEEFEQSWEHIDGEARRAFIEYLERSCISEFSGFLLFKELSRKVKAKIPDFLKKSGI